METTPCVVYLRFSPRPDNEEDPCQSIENQRLRCDAYCKLTGLEVLKHIEDPSASAYKTPLVERPGGKRLLNFLSRRGVAIVAQRLDRLFRDSEDGQRWIRFWGNMGIVLHLADEGGCTLTTGTAIGKLLLGVRLLTCEFESDLIADRTRDGMTRCKKENRRTSRDPQFGWQFVTNRFGVLVEEEDEEEQAIMRNVHNLTGKMSMSAIAYYLNQHGVRPARRSQKPWEPRSLARTYQRWLARKKLNGGP